MSVDLVAPDLARWDGTPELPELLVATLFADERPLRGVLGLVDWRTCGRLSRLVRAGRLTGAAGETTLLPIAHLAFRRLLVVGLGPAAAFDERRFRDAARRARDAVDGLHVERAAIMLPGRQTDRIAARRALALWLDEAGPDRHIWLVEPPPVQKDLAEFLRR